MNELAVFNIDGIDCYEKDGTAYLKLEAVARGLGFTTVAASGNEVVRWKRVEGYLAEIGFPNLRGKDDFIPENVFYRLAMKAKSEAAERFQALIADEVIPAIRKHGAYMTPATIEEVLLTPDTIIKIATALKEEQEKNKVLTAKNAELAPKALFADAVSVSDTSILVGALAKILTQNGMKIGQNRLFERLRNEGYLMRRGDSKNIPTQEAMEMGLFEVKERVHMKPDGTPRIDITTYVTGKGQTYFVKKYLEKKS